MPQISRDLSFRNRQRSGNGFQPSLCFLSSLLGEEKLEHKGDLLTLRGLKWSKNTGKHDNTTKVSSKTKFILHYTIFRHK